jgi:hypothetical protein
MLFKKIFPKRINKINNNKINALNASVNIDEVNNGRYTVNNKNDLLNTSFQKKKNLGTFKIVNKKSEGNKNINLNLDLSFDYSKKNLINEPNKSTNIDDYSNNNTEMDLLRNKYNKKVIGNYKQLSHTKNYPSTMLSYQEFDEPIKAEKKEEKEKEKNLNNKWKIYENLSPDQIQRRQFLESKKKWITKEDFHRHFGLRSTSIKPIKNIMIYGEPVSSHKYRDINPSKWITPNGFI